MSTNDKHILLVEDNAILRKAFSVALSRRGYQVATAVDGLDGLNKIRTAPPDLVLLDLVMPQLDGLGMLRELRADPAIRDCRVLLTSNSTGDADRKEAFDLGVVGYLVKANHSLEEFCNEVGKAFEVQ